MALEDGTQRSVPYLRPAAITVGRPIGHAHAFQGHPSDRTLHRQEPDARPSRAAGRLGRPTSATSRRAIPDRRVEARTGTPSSCGASRVRPGDLDCGPAIVRADQRSDLLTRQALFLQALSRR